MYSTWLHNIGTKLSETTKVTENVKKERKQITMVTVPLRIGKQQDFFNKMIFPI